MDEVRCPMCSKPNPGDAEACEFCGARIKPLIIHQEPEGVSRPEKQQPDSPIEQSAEEPRAETDWLNRMRFGVESDEGDESELEETATGLKRGETDLLGRFRDLGIADDEQEMFLEGEASREEPEAAIEDELVESDPLSDIMQRVSQQGQEIEHERNLTGLVQDRDTEPPFSEEVLSETPITEPEDDIDLEEVPVPDWLARIRARKEIEEVSQPTKTGETDWLTGLREVSFTEDEPEEDILDFEQDVLDSEVSRSIDEILEPLLPAGIIREEPLSDQDEEIDASPASVEDLISELDLLSFDESEERTGDDLPPDFAPPSLSKDDELLLDDLFADLDLPEPDSEKAILDEDIFAKYDSPDEGASDQIIPDDLFADFLVSPKETEQETLRSGNLGEPEGSLHEEEESLLDADFFAELGFDVAAEVKGPSEAEPSADYDELPDEVFPSDEDFFADLVEGPGQFQDFAPGSDLLAKQPDLDDLDEILDEPSDAVPFTDAPKEKSALSELLGDFSPSWLDESIGSDRDALPHVPALILDDELPPIDLIGTIGEDGSTEIPSWLQDLGKDVDEEFADQDEDLPVLVKATLPPWLEAMRPLQTFKAPPEFELEEEEEIVEAAGPLAGLKGVLLAEPVVAMPRTPIVSVGTLDVSERDYNQAEILQRMVEEEEREEEWFIPRRVQVPLIRWVSAALLVLGVTIPSLLGFPSFRSPTRAPRDLSPFLELVGNTPVDSPSLLIFDYEPSYSAEMDAVAGALVENLMARGQPLITLSTQPSGPLLADRMLRRVGLVHDAKNGEDYLHLGYLSGGPTAVQLFAASPSESLAQGFRLPEEFEGDNAWDSSLLQNIAHLSDFAMVVVISSGTESARNWAEQVQPLMGSSPLLMVLSAGTEPIIRPYYETDRRRIDGILSGLPSAMIYEGVNGIQADATHRWNGYGTSVLISVMILLAGAGYGVVTWIISRFKSRESRGIG